jgi:hypothetical protein
MPLVRIDLDDAIPAHRRRAIADAIHDALVPSPAMPPHDRFQIITTHPGQDELIFDALIFATVTENAAEDRYAGVDSAALP